MTIAAKHHIAFPSLILGSNVFGWSLDEKASFAILDAAYERGLTTLDTADIYSYWGAGNTGGESETLIGKWLHQRQLRQHVTLHTKGGAPGAPGEFADAKLNAAYLTKAIEGSLRRLGTDHIDLYYVHYDDKVTPVEETLRVFDKMIASGKIRAIAASNYSATRLLDALNASADHELPRFSGFQTLYNLYDRQAFETEFESLCIDQQLPVLSYFSLASGFLTGKYRTEADAVKSAARGGSVKAYMTPRGFRILDALDHVAAEHDATPAQVALAWLIAHPSVAAPIASATSLSQLDQLVAATRLRLSADAIKELNAASSYQEVNP